jgi:hypothetical protein
MTIRTGSWDRFAEYIRWSNSPSSPPQQATQVPSASPPASAPAGLAGAPPPVSWLLIPTPLSTASMQFLTKRGSSFPGLTRHPTTAICWG